MGLWGKPRKAIAIGRSFGSYLVIGSEPEPRPSDFVGLASGAITLANKVYSTDEASPSMNSLRRMYDVLTRHLKSSGCFSEPYHPWADVYKSIFWHALCLNAQSDSKRTKNFAEFSTFGSQSQRALIRAFLNLSQEDRQFIYYLPGPIPLEPQRWRETFSGAMSVARVAMALNQLGLAPILSNPHEDVHQKIDLLVAPPNSEDTLLCMQIKSARTEKESRLELVNPQHTEGDSMELARFKRGMRDFQFAQGIGKINGAFIHVGEDQSRRWEHEKHQRLSQCFQELFASIGHSSPVPTP